MIDFNKTDNPTLIAEEFAKSQMEKSNGYRFDFSIKSLDIELERYLENKHNKELNEREILNATLTAYLGETICRNFNAKWTGAYYGPLNPNGVNYYTCKISLYDSDFYVSRYFDAFFSDRGINEDDGTFNQYLYGREPHPRPNIIYYEGLITMIKKTIANKELR